MEENKVMKSLFDETLAYRKYAQDIHPSRVDDMLKKAFEAGKKEADKETMKFLSE